MAVGVWLTISQKCEESQGVKGYGRLTLPNVLHLVWSGWKGRGNLGNQWFDVVNETTQYLGIGPTAKFSYCNFSVLPSFSSSAIKNSTFNAKQS